MKVSRWRTGATRTAGTAGPGPTPADTGTTDPGATQVVPGRPGRTSGRGAGRARRSTGFVSLGTVVTVVGALSATLLGGGLASQHTDLLDGNTWIVASTRDGVERLLRVNPGSSEVDLDTPSPLPAGAPAQIQQSNVTTAVVDATTGDTYTWDGVGGRWQKSTTRVSGDTALHLTTTAAFTVDRATGTLRQLDTKLLSTPIGAALSLGSTVSDSAVDGSGQLWLALPRAKKVVAVKGSAHGPSITREFKLPSSGSALTLTALTSGVLATDAAGRTSYRLLPNRGAAERITGVPPSASAVSASSSDDDTGAVLDPATGTLTRVAPAGDRRRRSISLGRAASDRLGRPLVFGNQVYLPDYTAGKVLRSTPGGVVELLPVGHRLSSTGGDFALFVDDGRLWVNSAGDAHAYSVDETGQWTTITKAQKQPIKPPGAPSTRHHPSSVANPQVPRNPGPTGPPVANGRNGHGAKRPPGPKPTVPPTPTKSPTPSPTNSPKPTPTKSPTPSPTPAPPPDAPANFTVTPGDSSLSASWQSPSGAADVSKYVLDWTPTAGGTPGSATVPAGTLQHTIAGLTNGVSYTVTVRADTADSQGAQAGTTGTPVTTAGVVLQNAASNGSGQIGVSFTVSENGSGSVTCKVLLSGVEKWSGACAGASSPTITGLTNSTSYTVAVQATNNQGTTTSASRSVTTWGPRTVTISKGANAQGQGTPTCTDPSCAWIVVHIENFTPGRGYPMTGNDDHPANGDGSGPFPQRTITPESNGQTTVSGAGITYYFGYPGYHVWIDVDGVESNHLTW